MGGGSGGLVALLAGGGGLAMDQQHQQRKESALDDLLGDLEGPLAERERRMHNEKKRPLPANLSFSDGLAPPPPAFHQPSGTWQSGAPNQPYTMASSSSNASSGRAPKKQRREPSAASAAIEPVQPKHSRSGRTLKQTVKAGYEDGLLSDSGSTDGYSLSGYEDIAEEENFMAVLDRAGTMGIPQLAHNQSRGNLLSMANDEDYVLIEGQHVVVDTTRGSLPLPIVEGRADYDPEKGIQTSKRPGLSNVARVTKVGKDGTCNVRFVCNCAAGNPELDDVTDPSARARLGSDGPSPCSAGRELVNVAPNHRQIVCSSCMHANLPMVLPQLWCSGCAKIIKNGQKYHKDQGQRLNIKLCTDCYRDLRAHNTTPVLLEEMELDSQTFEVETWNAKEMRDYDWMVQCDGPCQRWYHYICAMYPDVAALPSEYGLEQQKFICDHRRRNPSVTIDQASSGRLLSLRARRAADLKRHPLSDAIERFVEQSNQSLGITCNDLVVRVVSSRRFHYPALPAMKERYGPNYPDNFPYDSRALFAFQKINGRDVCIFAMYVQEYGPDCPQPNTNRTYISYLDSVRMLETTPANQRTPVYHSIINGYLANARDRGFEHAHIWVAPPQPGDEYIFHCHPLDPRHGTRTMGYQKLRSWYVKMLDTAIVDGIVTSYKNIEEHVNHLSSIRDFPLFEGEQPTIARQHDSSRAPNSHLTLTPPPTSYLPTYRRLLPRSLEDDARRATAQRSRASRAEKAGVVRFSRLVEEQDEGDE